MIISNTLTAIIKINEKKLAFKYRLENNFSETDLIEFVELIYHKTKLLNNLDGYKLSIELFAGDHLLSYSDNSKKDNFFWQYPSFAEIFVNNNVYEANKNIYASYFKNRILTLNRQIKEGRIFNNTYTININNFLTGKKDRRRIVYNNSYNEKGFIDKTSNFESKQKMIIYHRNGKTN